MYIDNYIPNFRYLQMRFLNFFRFDFCFEISVFCEVKKSMEFRKKVAEYGKSTNHNIIA